MQTLRDHCDIEMEGRPAAEALGSQASALGGRLLAAARVAEAMHLAEATRRLLLSQPSASWQTGQTPAAPGSSSTPQGRSGR